MRLYESNKKIVNIFLILILIISFFYFFAYQNKHTDWVNLKPEISLSAKELLERFQSEDNNELINMVVQISGSVSSIDDSLFLLDKVVVCKPAPNTTVNFNKKDSINIKGRCIGYDNLLMEVRLDNVVLLEE